MSSIFLFSQSKGRCVELELPQATPTDLEALHGALPRNVSGLSFSRPEINAPQQGSVKYHSVSSPQHVAEHLSVLGDRMLNASQPLAALRFYDLATRMSPDSSLHLKRAEALFALGRLEDSKKETDYVLRHECQNASASLLRGKIALHQERYQDAVLSFRCAEKFAGDETFKVGALAYLSFARIYQDRDQLHLRNLSPNDYVVEIQQLQTRARLLREDLRASQAPFIQGLDIHLDALDNLFSNWLRELSATTLS